MLFSGIEFLFRFLPIFMLIYLLVPEKYRNLVLFSGSLLFYGIGEPYYVLLFMCSILVNYGFNYLLDRMENGRKLVLILALIYNFGFLFVFKYWDFAAGNLNRIMAGEPIPLFSLALPLGISFYTFQMVSYLIDHYCGKINSKVSFVSYGTYVSMFPQLIAGPIVKYQEVEEQLDQRKLRPQAIESGMKLFCIGLASKVLLANQIGTLWNTIMTAGAGNLSAAAAWLGAASYSFQIYFDFWGYSLMARGLGQMFGFRIPRNFNHPYMAKSISEFWRRWHITLGRWFREYVYIPLGGNRKGYLRTTLNLFVVWAFTGLWHGAGWNFVLWGILFFLLLSLEKCGIGKWMEHTKVLGHLYVIILIPITWVIFSIDNMSQLVQYLQNMAGIHTTDILVGYEQVVRYLQEYGILLIACVIFSTRYPAALYKKYRYKWYTVVLLLILFWTSVYEIILGKNNPFLYFRF